MARKGLRRQLWKVWRRGCSSYVGRLEDVYSEAEQGKESVKWRTAYATNSCSGRSVGHDRSGELLRGLVFNECEFLKPRLHL